MTASDQEVYGGTLADVAEPESVLLPGHDVPLGRYTVVRRLLPQRPRRLVGPWCFVDQFGPDDVRGRPGMQVPPHPHTGLQTVTWLVQGQILHRDSLGSVQGIRPGQLNLMTSGHGIAHSEQSPPDHPDVMHGLQLWVALPDSARHGDPRFDHYPTLPLVRHGAALVTVVAGQLLGERSPAVTFSPLVAAEVSMPEGGREALPVDPDFEHGLLVLSGAARVGTELLEPGALLYLPRGRSDVTVDAAVPTRLFVVGGEPFDEPLVMWWNFVARSHEEIVRAREEWVEHGSRFGAVAGCMHEALPAPAMPTVRLKARDRHGGFVD